MKRRIEIIGLIASLIGIFVFITGKQSVPEMFSRISATPTPTMLITVTPTTSPNEIPFLILDVDPKNLMPSNDDISSEVGFNLEDSYYVSNEEFVKDRSDAVAVVIKAKEFGRINGYENFYLNPDLCSGSSYKSLQINVSIFESIEGTNKFIDYYINLDQSAFVATAMNILIDAGEDRKFYVADDVEFNSCPPNTSIHRVLLGFRRYNVLVMLNFAAFSDSQTENNDILKQVEKIAKLVDLRIVSEALNK